MYRFLIVIISIYLSVTAFIQLPEIMQYDSKRILQLFVLASIGAIFAGLLVKRIYYQEQNKQGLGLRLFNPIGIFLAVLLVGGIISSLLSSNIRYAFLELSFLFLLLTLSVLLVPKTLKEHHFLGRVILITALIYSSAYVIIFFGNYISSFLNPMITIWPEKYNFTLTIDGVELTGKEVLYFDHKRFFNHTQTWTLPLLLGLLTYYQGIKNSNIIAVALIFLTSIWWMLIFASGGRGSIIGLTVAIFLILIICKSDALHLFKNGISTMFFGLFFYFIFFRFLVSETPSMPFLRDTASGRFEMWDKAMEMWMQNPLFGVGPMHYAKFGEVPYFVHPHNFYLQLLSEWGLIGFAAFAVLGAVFLKMIYKNYNNIERGSSSKTIYLAFTWSILAAFIHAFFSGVMHTPMSQMWFVLLTAWFIGYKRYDISIPKRPGDCNYLYIIYLFFLIIVITLVYEDLLNLTSSYTDYMSRYPGDTFYPRFWFQGLFE